MQWLMMQNLVRDLLAKSSNKCNLFRFWSRWISYFLQNAKNLVAVANELIINLKTTNVKTFLKYAHIALIHT